MKILFCTNVFEVVENGPVKFANLLLEINDRYPEHELRILTEDVTAPRRYVHKVALSNRWKTSPLSQFVRMWVYHQEAMRVQAEFPFDVVVYNNALVGLVSTVFFGNTVGMINDDNNAGSPKPSISFSKNGVKQWVFRWLEKSMAHKSRKIIVNSDYLKELVVKAYSLPRHKIFRLYKGNDFAVQTSIFKKINTLVPVRVLFVKNDYRRGGLDVLANALSLLPYRFSLTIIGPNEIDRKAIEAIFLPIRNTTINLLGKRPQQEVLEQMLAADIFCVPSFREALGVANLEAMACGLPVITTRVGGIPEVLNENGQSGWLVPPGDARALSEAIHECISQPELRHQKLKAAQLQAQKFSKEVMFSNFLSILSA